MKKVVIYHGSCNDGMCCAFLMAQAFPDADLIPAQHGTSPPDDLDECEVYLVDFSYKRPVMEDLVSRCGRLVVIDHHESAQREVDGLEGCECIFDMNHSGGRLVWDYVCTHYPAVIGDFVEEMNIDYCAAATDGVHVPWFVAYTEDRDLWLNKLPKSEEVDSAIRLFPLNVPSWMKVAQKSVEEMARLGEPVVAYKNVILDSHVRHAVRKTIAGFDVPVVNGTWLFSEVAGALSAGEPFAAVYFDTPEHRVYSLRSDENGENVAEIAEKFGGGGHARAAGFQVPHPVGYDGKLAESRVANNKLSPYHM